MASIVEFGMCTSKNYPGGTDDRTSSRPAPTSAAPTTSTIGPCGTTKTTNKVPGAVKEPEVPNKDPKQFFRH